FSSASASAGCSDLLDHISRVKTLGEQIVGNGHQEGYLRSVDRRKYHDDALVSFFYVVGKAAQIVYIVILKFSRYQFYSADFPGLSHHIVDFAAHSRFLKIG